MAQTALPAPRPQVARPPARLLRPVRRRRLGMGVVKAMFWFVVIIMLLGYLPDRAYYFTVQTHGRPRAAAWSPINFCPPANQTLPCPAPAGATLPVAPSPPEIQLPAGAPTARRG